jgi:hypothetical protein
MKTLALILLVIVFAACKPQKLITQVPVESRTTISQRPVVLHVPQDYASVSALFTCDSNNRVILADYAELNSKYMALRSIITQTPDGGLGLKINARTVRQDTVIVVSDTTIYKEVPVVTQVPVIVEKPYSNLVKVLIVSGCLLWAVALVYIVKIFKSKTLLK